MESATWSTYTTATTTTTTSSIAQQQWATAAFTTVLSCT